MVYAYGNAYETDMLLAKSIVKGICYDSLGNEAEFITYVGIDVDNFSEIPMGVGGIGFSAVSVIQHYNADDIYDIAGIGSYVGGGIDAGFSVGYDAIVLGKTVAEVVRSQGTSTIDGWQISVGFGIGINWVHEGNSYTILRPIKEKGVSIPKDMRKWVDKKPNRGIFEM